jgi:uncharacterized membrane protein
MYWQHWGAGAGLWPFHLLCLVMIGLLIWGAISWFDRRGRRLGSFSTGRPYDGPDAMEVLRQRYARGEIDATTFEQMRERLGGSDRPRS